jgi:hypothetical protein
MFKGQKTQTAPAHNLAAIGDRLDLPSVPAAWPTGVSQLALAIEACQRCDTGEVCTDWLARAPKRIATPPVFCPNADALTRATQAKSK